MECIHREEVNPELARRDESQIDDVILRRMQARIDLEELRLADDIGTEYAASSSQPCRGVPCAPIAPGLLDRLAVATIIAP